MEKFRARCSMVDPVTNQPRFGPKMLAKVQDLLRRYDDVKVAMEEDAPLRLQGAKRTAELAQQQEQKRLQQEAREREAEQEREEQQRVESLAAAAQTKREQREKERAEAEQQRKLEEEEREHLNASIPHGNLGLEMGIAMLRESTGSEATYRQSLQKLLVVVSNICGHQCLLALGFKELQQGDETQPRDVFVLEEPDLSEDLDVWSNWFDELKEMQNLVEAKLS
ncbi:hypothetical protein PHMEG_0006136 [Phytophthora megakarya]|uniref:PUB domain-containing protein n=1 Tax=Phytophthora megakarya TaxID=4795 RepID=A0A225WRC0_9STRA|nr:hypothetical protein PHMEG_0006136 [Phytophthora megakarya]